MSGAVLHCGHALEVLRMLPDGIARCCVTSPPYWGLRDYGTATWEGGDAECSHEPTQEWIDHNFNAKSAFGAGAGTQSAAAKKRWYKTDGSCPDCGATRKDRQLGLERTPEEYVARLVEVFGEVRRVLTNDGTLWLNLGDSYTAGGSNRNGLAGNPEERRKQGWGGDSSKRAVKNIKALVVGIKTGVKPKDLVGIPWRVAFALQADGWWLRSDIIERVRLYCPCGCGFELEEQVRPAQDREIIWSKPNPMPESVTDRPTKSHEYVFLLSKSARYYYDAEAIAEEATYGDHPRNGTPDYVQQAPGQPVQTGITKRRRSDKQRGHSRRHAGFNNRAGARNARSVWQIATQPYPEAHFATFPEELARRCILAGSAPGDTVLDPFGGSGTVAQVATGNGRGAIYIDLNPAYVEMARARIGPLLCCEA